jgi:hypothetical protein
MCHIFEFDVVNVSAVAGKKTNVFLPAYGLTDAVFFHALPREFVL